MSRYYSSHRTSYNLRLIQQSLSSKCADVIIGEDGVDNGLGIRVHTAAELLCPKPKVLKVQTSTNNPAQTRNQRISQLVQTKMGGTIVYGNNGVPYTVNYLDRLEGQPGGGGAPIRNQF
jgi:hypothetical protein